MTNGDWIHEAMSDDSLVAEALICLFHSEPPPNEKTSGGGASDLELKWTVRQRRTPLRKKGDPNTRGSPTTPLSWSGATDGFDESSSAVKLSETARSKISKTSVSTTPLKRSRKKKTLAQLKEEESLLLKERKCLKNELASMRNQIKQQRSRKEFLKKLQVESQKNDDSIFLLPDLNIPLDDSPSPESSLYGTS